MAISPSTQATSNVLYQTDGFRIQSTVTGDVVRGTALTYGTSTEPDSMVRTTGPTDRLVAVVYDAYGGEAAPTVTGSAGPDAIPESVLWGHNVEVLIEDAAAVPYGAELVLSSITPGAFRPRVAGEQVPVWAVAKQAIAVPGVGLTARADLIAGGSASTAAISQFMLQGRIADVSTAGSTFSAPAPYAGNIIAIWSTLGGVIATADAALTFELGGVAITGGTITITQVGSAAGDVDSATPSALNAIAAGQPIEMITDGASTNVVPADLLFVIERTA